MPKQQYRTNPDGLEERTCACGNTYWVDESTRWKTMCYECWKTRKERAEAHFERTVGARRTNRGSDLEKEFHERLRTLIQLCHPDKHNQSENSVRITQWLISKKH